MKNFIKNSLSMLGFQITRKSSFNSSDPFYDMKLLMNGKPRVIFDVGAHHGHVTERFRSIFPHSEIYAFEPFQESFSLLRKNTRAYPNVNAFNFGLSDQAGMHSFHVNNSSATNSLLSTDIEGAKKWGVGILETVQVAEARFETIDSVVAKYNLSCIDILKLDVQGAESLVIAGAKSAIKNRLIRLIYTEIIIQPTYIGQRRFDHSLATFFDHGYELWNVYNLHSIDGSLCQLDAIFCLSGN
jgi:FkbM family methyltransferase